jgi:hypothetical protein
MKTGDPEAVVVDGVPVDYLFTWNRDGWPYEKLRSLVDGFRSKGVAVEPWRCLSHK